MASDWEKLQETHSESSIDLLIEMRRKAKEITGKDPLTQWEADFLSQMIKCARMTERQRAVIDRASDNCERILRHFAAMQRKKELLAEIAGSNLSPKW